MREKLDLQHKLAESIAKLLDEPAENREERILLIYGIEIFLNEFLKILLILLIAVLLEELKLAVFFTSYLIIARKCSGGKHCKSNLSCTIVTFLTAFIIPMFATKIVMSLWGLIGIGMIETVLIFILTPYTKPEEYIIKEQRLKRKLISVIAFCGFIGIAYLIGGHEYVNGILLIEAIVIFATIK